MNQINILTFGVIADITENRKLIMRDVPTTEHLVKALEEKYPLLKTIQYAIAVNKEVIQSHVGLDDDATVAILPPFSGG